MRDPSPSVVVTADGSRTLIRSPDGESFKSLAGALTEARGVYLEGSGVGERLRDGARTRVLEVGFGSGLNFLVTAIEAQRGGAPLAYRAVELRPPAAELLEELGYPDLLAPSPLPRALNEWRRSLGAAPAPGAHRFEHGDVRLTLLVGDARTVPLGGASDDAAFDAIYHDAFSPATNPELWSEPFLRELASRLAPGGRLVSFTVAGAVRRTLAAAGLDPRKVPGPPGGKREVLVAERPATQLRNGGGGAAVAARAGADRGGWRRAAADAGGSADVVVVGGGIAGASLHYELSRRGVDSLLLERSPHGVGGASGVPAALLNPHRGRSGRAHAADLAGMAGFWRLTAALEADVGASGAHRSGVLRIADNAKQARAWQRIAGTRWLEPGEVPDAYHAPFGAMLVEGGGWANTGVLLAALREAADEHGGRARLGVELRGLERRGSGSSVDGSIVVSVVASERELASDPTVAPAAPERSIRARTVVLAVGAWQPARLRLPRFELVWGEARVLQLGSTPPYPLAGSVVAAFEDGRALVSGGHRTVTDVGERVTQAPDAADALRRALAWQVPAAADAPELGRWHGVRAKRPSAEPVARRLAPGVYLLGGFGGRGFLRAAELSARLAERIATTL